jgi:anaerobic ribonucleoside-triphosphate reductase activating protein
MFMNYLGISKSSVTDGPGVRVVLWVSGCNLHCKGCQNPESWNFNSGKLFDEHAKKELFEALSKPYIQGITFSGGNPIDQPHQIFLLASEIKEKFPNKNIWLYSGYTYEQICLSREKYKVLFAIDVLVDGPFIEEQKDLTLKFRGSKNQRIIDVKKTIEQGEVALLYE